MGGFVRDHAAQRRTRTHARRLSAQVAVGHFFFWASGARRTRHGARAFGTAAQTCFSRGSRKKQWSSHRLDSFSATVF
jgi:hypothetical protein